MKVRILLAAIALLARTADARWIVVSDIDDTIKDTHVVDASHHRDIAHLLGDPFRKWAPVPGMAARYGGWSSRDRAECVYLSKSPWFYRPRLSAFLCTSGFPAGRLSLNPLFPFTPARFKNAPIRKLIRANPGCAFLLVGDSGEDDPEIFGSLAREFPRSVCGVFIRDVTPADPALRYHRAFAGVPRGRWHLFARASQLPASLDRPAKLPLPHAQKIKAHRPQIRLRHSREPEGHHPRHAAV
jgi:phosphatidate phosphatase APP1